MAERPVGGVDRGRARPKAGGERTDGGEGRARGQAVVADLGLDARGDLARCGTGDPVRAFIADPEKRPAAFAV